MSLIKQERITLASVTLNVATAGNPSNPALILLHGFPDFHETWKYQIVGLLEEGYFLIMPDQRGFNDSDKPQGLQHYSLDILRGDIIQLAQHFERKTFTIVGHDWGGVIGWSFAEEQPEYLDQLIVINAPSPSALAHQMSRSIVQILKFWYVWMFQLPFVSTRLMYPILIRSVQHMYSDHLDDSYIKRFSKPGVAHATINWYRSLVRRIFKERKQKRVDVPTLIIWGKKDTALSQSSGVLSADNCSDAQFVVLQSGTHWPHWDNPAWVNQLMIAFLARTKKKTLKKYK